MSEPEKSSRPTPPAQIAADPRASAIHPVAPAGLNDDVIGRRRVLCPAGINPAKLPVGKPAPLMAYVIYSHYPNP